MGVGEGVGENLREGAEVDARGIYERVESKNDGALPN